MNKTDFMLGINIRGFTKFGIKVLWRLHVLEYLRTLHLKFQMARTKIEVVLSTPCWLSQLWSEPSEILNLKVLKYSRNCSLHNALIPSSLKNPESPNKYTYDMICILHQIICCNIIKQHVQCYVHYFKQSNNKKNIMNNVNA